MLLPENFSPPRSLSSDPTSHNPPPTPHPPHPNLLLPAPLDSLAAGFRVGTPPPPPRLEHLVLRAGLGEFLRRRLDSAGQQRRHDPQDRYTSHDILLRMDGDPEP